MTSNGSAARSANLRCRHPPPRCQAFQPKMQRDQVSDVGLVLDDEDTGTSACSAAAD